MVYVRNLTHEFVPYTLRGFSECPAMRIMTLGGTTNMSETDTSRDRAAGEGSLWTAVVPTVGGESVVTVDRSVSATQVQSAIEAVECRATAFKGTVSDAALRATLGR